MKRRICGWIAAGFQNVANRKPCEDETRGKGQDEPRCSFSCSTIHGRNGKSEDYFCPVRPLASGFSRWFVRQLTVSADLLVELFWTAHRSAVRTCRVSIYAFAFSATPAARSDAFATALGLLVVPSQRMPVHGSRVRAARCRKRHDQCLTRGPPTSDDPLWLAQRSSAARRFRPLSPRSPL